MALPHPLPVLQQVCGFLRVGAFGDLESPPCSSCFIQWERNTFASILLHKNRQQALSS